MNSKKEVIGKRRKSDKIILFAAMPIMFVLLIFSVVNVDLTNMDDYELVGLILIVVLTVGTIALCIVMLKQMTEDLIILDKENKVLEIYYGQPKFKKIKSIFVKLEDIESVEYYKGEFHHYIIVATSRPACLGFMLKNGNFYGVYALKNPRAVEQLLQRLVLECNNSEE